MVWVVCIFEGMPVFDLDGSIFPEGPEVLQGETSSYAFVLRGFALDMKNNLPGSLVRCDGVAGRSKTEGLETPLFSFISDRYSMDS